MKKRSLMVFLFVGISCFLVFLWEWQKSRRWHARKADAYLNMYSIAGDLLNYSSMYFTSDLTLPGAVYFDIKDREYENPLGSWRFGCSIYLGSGVDGYKYFRIGEPWDSDINVKAPNFIYSWKGRSMLRTNKKRYWTNVMALTGPDTGFDLRFPDKLEGCEHLIIVVEVNNSGVHWGEPGDIDIRRLPPDFLKGTDGDGIMVLFYDGTIWFIKESVPLELLKQFFTATGARTYNRNDELIKYAITSF